MKEKAIIKVRQTIFQFHPGLTSLKLLGIMTIPCSFQFHRGLTREEI